MCCRLLSRIIYDGYCVRSSIQDVGFFPRRSLSSVRVLLFLHISLLVCFFLVGVCLHANGWIDGMSLVGWDTHNTIPFHAHMPYQTAKTQMQTGLGGRGEGGGGGGRGGVRKACFCNPPFPWSPSPSNLVASLDCIVIDISWAHTHCFHVSTEIRGEQGDSGWPIWGFLFHIVQSQYPMLNPAWKKKR